MAKEIAFCGYEEEKKSPAGSVAECRKPRRCCPTITAHADFVVLGGAEEGISVWTPQQFRDFVAAAKDGMFDGLEG